MGNSCAQSGAVHKKKLSFAEWVTENKPFIQEHLIHHGLSFIHEQAEDLRHPVTSLTLDNRWYYIDKPTRKQSYRASLESGVDGVPYLKLTYYTFRHGGRSARFDSKAALKALWQESRHTTLKPLSMQLLSQSVAAAPVIAPIDYLAQDLGRWHAMPCFGESHYLKRKGFFSRIIHGIRYGKNHIAVSIINALGEFQGLQTIFNDGQKRFSKGLAKKGHFALLGELGLPEKLINVHVCEGVATATSIHLATGEPVFSALDAFNLLPVCRNLKKRYPKANIIIWADNDWQKADKLLKSGQVLGNTGLIQANRTAFKLRNALVCTPDFTPFVASACTADILFLLLSQSCENPLLLFTYYLWITSEFGALSSKEKIQSATDFNDLHGLAGLGAIAQTQPQKPNLHLALWHELHHYTRYAHGAVTPHQFTSGLKHLYESRYLPKDLFQRDGVHLIRSAIGTGKTAVVEHLVKKNPNQSILFTTHLISLVESAAQRLGLTSYNRCDNFDLQMESRLAICLNSLGKLTAEGSLRDYDVVIIDEIEQVLARLTTHIEQKPLVFAVLQYVMSNAKTLICLDAHLSQATVQMIQRFCPSKPVTVHFNTYEPGRSRQIAFHENPESVQMGAMGALSHDKKVYLAFNSKKEAFKTFSALSLAFPEKKGLYISGDNAGDKENQAFFNDVNTVSQHYDYLICTPSVSTGVSIDNGHFDFVGGVFNAQINTANDCMQALGRIRNHPILHVWCEKRLGNKPLDAQVIASKWSSTHQHDIQLMNLDIDGSRIIHNRDYEHLALLVTQARHASYNDFYQQFALLALHDGMQLGYCEQELAEAHQKQLRDFKKAAIEQDTALIAQERLPLNVAELVALAKKPRKTMQDTRQYKKHQLMEFYNLAESDQQSIEAMGVMDKEGQFKQQILALELALGDTELAKKRFMAQIENSSQFAADLNHFATQQMLYKKLLEVLRLSKDNGSLSIEDYHYTPESLIEGGFLMWIDEHRATLQGIITIPSLQKLNQDPIRFISSLLARLGLKQKRVGRAENGIYHLCGERTRLLNALILRRAKGRGGVSIPLDTSACPVKKTIATDFFLETFRAIKRFFTPKIDGDLVTA